MGAFLYNTRCKAPNHARCAPSCVLSIHMVQSHKPNSISPSFFVSSAHAITPCGSPFIMFLSAIALLLFLLFFFLNTVLLSFCFTLPRCCFSLSRLVGFALGINRRLGCRSFVLGCLCIGCWGWWFTWDARCIRRDCNWGLCSFYRLFVVVIEL